MQVARTIFYETYGRPTVTKFSSFINSIFQFLPSFLWSTDYNKNQFPSTTIPKSFASSGMLRRQESYPGNSSNATTDSSGARYVYSVDTCQTVYLVEKDEDGSYEVTILYTKELRVNWLEAKLRVILLRILIAEGNIPVLNQLFQTEGGWKIVGSIDCQKDRSYATNSFHQDGLLTEFIDPLYRFMVDDFLRDIFSPRPEFFSPTVLPGVRLGSIPPPDTAHSWFSVYSHLTAHFGILDYDSIVAIIAAAVKTDTEYIFTILPPSTFDYRPFLFYLNSIIHHATPSSFTQDDITRIIAHYNQQGQQLPPGFTSLEGANGITFGSLKEALENYNELFDEALEHPRNFRRLLGKILPTESMRQSTDIQRKSDRHKRKKTAVGLIRSGDRSSDESDETDLPYQSISKKTSELKTNFKNHENAKKYLEDIDLLTRITEKYNKLKKSKVKVNDEIIFGMLIKEFGLSPNYYVYASKKFTQDEATKIKTENIAFLADNPSMPKIDISETTGMNPHVEEPRPLEINSIAGNIKIFKLPTAALRNRGGSKRNKSRQGRNTKKKLNKLIKRRFSQRKQNKKRRSRKIR
jgi:hypothetical protein